MINLYSENSKMCDVIADEPALLMMMSRFGMPLGVAEKSVKEVCEANQIDVPTFLAVANFTKHGPGVVDRFIGSVSVKALVAYLSQAHSYFLDFQLPAIRRKLLEAIDTAQQNEVAFLILKFYDGYMAEVRRHMLHENRKIFAYVSELLAGQRRADFEIAQFARSHTGINQKLQELKNIIIKYYTPTPESGEQLNNVLFDIFTCEHDLRLHCELEDALFVPAVEKLEEHVALASQTEPSPTAEDAAQDALTDREREVVGCIVRGLTNKEIADKLFISVNTVLTHRKNISRKLNIHSVSGLTIYAIVNKIVDLGDIKIQ